MSQRWTPAEDAALRKAYAEWDSPSVRLADIAAKIGRSQGAVAKRAQALDLTDMKTRCARTAPMRRRL